MNCHNGAWKKQSALERPALSVAKTPRCCIRALVKPSALAAGSALDRRSSYGMHGEERMRKETLASAACPISCRLLLLHHGCSPKCTARQMACMGRAVAEFFILRPFRGAASAPTRSKNCWQCENQSCDSPFAPAVGIATGLDALVASALAKAHPTACIDHRSEPRGFRCSGGLRVLRSRDVGCRRPSDRRRKPSTACVP